ncbi:flagellar biosynthesis protein FlhB [Rhodophyticola porphyridii]|uniref:EscU/YscU/HrcU family type III secretion system export apparatus switch protein n=1 Tax=Rhodophyticola porphyridii TaxID=1852017 RepID=UPI001B2F7875|nr:flagellar biosynthesis protein FlhB [Roseicyclus sp.]MBO6923559.1 flagellar biosynthesis protein FlhB [Roseicyclus sp.]
MSDDQPSSDKPYDPTPKKLEDARQKGEIVRSTDLNTAVVYGGMLLGAALFGQTTGVDIGHLSQVVFGRADTLAALILAPGGQALSGGMIWVVMVGFLTLIAVPAALLIASLFAQRAILFTPSKLAPKLSRISPIANAKNKFGANGLFEFAKSSAKLAIYSILLGAFLWVRSDKILTSIYASDGQVIGALGQLVMEFLAFVFIIALMMGAVDYLWQWGEHQKKNRMSRQELVDETKQSEGDPHMKQQRRQRGYDLAMNQMLQDVPNADVVVVNPTHYAVALKWDRGKGTVPVCVAKGVDEIAARIRELAAEHGVPIFHDPPTARALHATIEIGAPIAPDHFRAVAAAIRFADTMRSKARSVMS